MPWNRTYWSLNANRRVPCQYHGIPRSVLGLVGEVPGAEAGCWETASISQSNYSIIQGKGKYPTKSLSMNIDISQYRAIIGTFNQKYKNIKVQWVKPARKMSYKCPTKMGKTYKFLSYLFILFVLLNSYKRKENSKYGTHNQIDKKMHGSAQSVIANQIYSYNI